MNVKTVLKQEFTYPETLTFDGLLTAKPPTKAKRESEISSNFIYHLTEYSRDKRERNA